MSQTDPERAPQREVPRDSWGVLQRVYGVRHSLLWPGQFAMADILKFMTVWALFLSTVAVIFKIAPVSRLWDRFAAYFLALLHQLF